MQRPLPFNLGDQVTLKKSHACGTNLWEIIRVGADMRARCTGCGHLVTMGRFEFEGRVRRIVSTTQEQMPG